MPQRRETRFLVNKHDRSKFVTSTIAQESITQMLTGLEKKDDTVAKKYLVLSTPRVGSNLLFRGLKGTGALGLPTEWFNILIVKEVHARMGWRTFDANRYVRTVVRGSKTENGVFGLKVHIGQYRHWLKQGVDILKIGFDHVYYIERGDKIAQAYSYAKAEKTGHWTVYDEEKSTPKKVDVSPTDVAHRLHAICEDLDFFSRHFASIKAHRFLYEDLVADLGEQAVRTILSDLGLSASETGNLRSDLPKQSSGKRREKVDAIKRYFLGT